MCACTVFPTHLTIAVAVCMGASLLAFATALRARYGCDVGEVDDRIPFCGIPFPLGGIPLVLPFRLLSGAVDINIGGDVSPHHSGDTCKPDGNPSSDAYADKCCTISICSICFGGSRDLCPSHFDLRNDFRYSGYSGQLGVPFVCRFATLSSCLAFHSLDSERSSFHFISSVLFPNASRRHYWEHRANPSAKIR